MPPFLHGKNAHPSVSEKKSNYRRHISVQKLVGPGVVGSGVVGPEGVVGASVVEISRQRRASVMQTPLEH